MAQKNIKTLLTSVGKDNAQKDGLMLTRLLGVQLMERLQKTIASGTPSEQDLWLWGEKENAVSLWVKLSGSLLKVMEYETLLSLGKEAGAQKNISEDDARIIERFVALRHASPSGTEGG